LNFFGVLPKGRKVVGATLAVARLIGAIASVIALKSSPFWGEGGVRGAYFERSIC